MPRSYAGPAVARDLRIVGRESALWPAPADRGELALELLVVGLDASPQVASRHFRPRKLRRVVELECAVSVQLLAGWAIEIAVENRAPLRMQALPLRAFNRIQVSVRGVSDRAELSNSVLKRFDLR